MVQMPRIVDVTLEATGAWEVWSVRVPDDVPEDEVLTWAREYYHEADDKWLSESGADHYVVSEVTYGNETLVVGDENA